MSIDDIGKIMKGALEVLSILCAILRRYVLWRRYLLQWCGRRNEVNPNTYPHAAVWQHFRSDLFTKWLRVISVMTHSIHSFIKSASPKELKKFPNNIYKFPLTMIHAFRLLLCLFSFSYNWIGCGRYT